MELLAPAGSVESLKAAVNAGADAVYMGGIRFSARAYADNAGEDDFIEGIRYAHRYGAKVYMTVNTLFKPDELNELISYIKPYYKAGVDAVLVQDLGVLNVLKNAFPDLPLHASTQMTITNKHGARFLKELGLTRIVPAREISLAEIKDIKENVDIEVETFVHGALCYCYSGQCLMSSFIGGRSGNRGRCAQACRLEYSCNARDGIYEGQLLSLKDLCSINLIPQLAEAGIDSFKIEGRMKSPRYTAGVTEVWRKYIDRFNEVGADGYSVDKKDMQMLADLFDRGGRTEGYYFKHNGPDMMAWEERADRRNNEDLYSYLDERYVNAMPKIKLEGMICLHAGKPAVIEARNSAFNEDNRIDSSIAVRVEGDTVETAKSKALTKEEVAKQIEKTGGSPYEWNTLIIDVDDNVFMPLSKINALRRMVFEKYEEEVQSKYVRS